MVRVCCSRVLFAVGLVVATACSSGTEPAAGSLTDGGGLDRPDSGILGGADAGLEPVPCVDTQGDPANCGACGVRCAFPNAAATCVTGRCVRGPCTPGQFDLDSDPANGCEAACEGTKCTTSSGPLTLAAPPLPETGLVVSVVASTSPISGDGVPFPSFAVMGEATPLPFLEDRSSGDTVVTTGVRLQNLVGFGAAFR